MTVYSDRVKGILGQTQQKATYYETDIISANDYYPFGQVMRTRHYPNNGGVNGFFTRHRYGFNGKEADYEGEINTLNTYDYGFRIYNPRIARFLSVDPLAHKLPDHRPYNYCANNPILYIDPDGRDWYKDNEGHYRYNKDLNSVNAISILKKGESCVGYEYTDKTKNGTNEYRKDGSVLFGSQQDAVSRMTSIPENPGKEQFEFISGDKVLVTPDKVNDGGDLRPWNACYKIGDGEFTIPITRLDQKFDATVHTHPRDNYYSNSGNAPSGDDMKTRRDHYPGKLGFTIGLGNRKIYKYYIDGNGNDKAQNTGISIDNFKNFTKR